MTDFTNKRPAIELLAPAGDMEKLKTAVYYGADAVYLFLKSGKQWTFSTPEGPGDI